MSEGGSPVRHAGERPDVAPVHDVLVIGAGPAGSSCAYWLADAGWDVVVVEKKRFPREKTCGDGLTPRAVRQLADMGMEDALAGSHRYVGLRACGWGHTLEMAWPDHPAFPSYGYTITRHDLDGLVAERAGKAGATVLQGTEAVAPILEDGERARPAGSGKSQGRQLGNGAGTGLPYCLGAVVRDPGRGDTRELRARYVVVADGSTSRFGWALGTARQRDYPLGMALRGYYRSPRHDDPFIESHLDIRGADGEVVPGYGWIFPLGDGRVNVGVGLLSTDRRWKGVNTSRLMDAFVAGAPASWGLSPETSCGPPTGGKLPMSLAVGPHTGPNTVVVGDAGGAINPFNGEGIAYGYETGRLAAAHVADALSGEGPAALERYDRCLDDAYGDYYRVGRSFVRLISNPRAMRWCVSAGMRSETFMTELLRIMANLMRPEAPGAAELGYDALLGLSRVVPAGLLEALTG
jgi:menaquinone-9 beta-reductase